MNIVIPMAGRGSRFAELGYRNPKPMIDVLGKPMYAWATDGLPLPYVKQLIFICQREHLSHWGLEADIRARYAKYQPRIVPLAEVTQGQACTVLMATEWIDNDDPLLIYNADTYCPTTIFQALRTWPLEVAGALDVFEAEGERWSFAELGAENRVRATSEKRRTSQWASTGLYYFRRGADFVKHANQMIAANAQINHEFYIAPIYNQMIANGADIRANPVENVWVLGTPEDLQHFLANNTLS